MVLRDKIGNASKQKQEQQYNNNFHGRIIFLEEFSNFFSFLRKRNTLLSNTLLQKQDENTNCSSHEMSQMIKLDTEHLAMVF